MGVDKLYNEIINKPFKSARLTVDGFEVLEVGEPLNIPESFKGELMIIYLLKDDLGNDSIDFNIEERGLIITHKGTELLGLTNDGVILHKDLKGGFGPKGSIPLASFLELRRLIESGEIMPATRFTARKAFDNNKVLDIDLIEKHVKSYKGLDLEVEYLTHIVRIAKELSSNAQPKDLTYTEGTLNSVVAKAFYGGEPEMAELEETLNYLDIANCEFPVVRFAFTIRRLMDGSYEPHGEAMPSADSVIQDIKVLGFLNTDTSIGKFVTAEDASDCMISVAERIIYLAKSGYIKIKGDVDLTKIAKTKFKTKTEAEKIFTEMFSAINIDQDTDGSISTSNLFT